MVLVPELLHLLCYPWMLGMHRSCSIILSTPGRGYGASKAGWSGRAAEIWLCFRVVEAHAEPSSPVFQVSVVAACPLADPKPHYAGNNKSSAKINDGGGRDYTLGTALSPMGVGCC